MVVRTEHALASAEHAVALQDGSVAGRSVVEGRLDVQRELQSSRKYRGVIVEMNWQEPKPLLALQVFTSTKTSRSLTPIAIKLIGQAPDGEFDVRLFHTEFATFQHERSWQDTDKQGRQASMYEARLHAPYVTRGLKIVLGAYGDRVRLGDLRVLLADAPLPEPAAPQPLNKSSLQAWFGDPWVDTEGGSRRPSEQELQAPWQIRMARNDTEQAMLGFMNLGRGPGAVTLRLRDVPPGLSAELMAVGKIERRRGTPRVSLMNIFSEQQVRGFHGYFPKQFVEAEVWSNFPTLKLQPGAPAYVWLKLRSDGETLAPGRYTVRLEALAADGTLSWPIDVDVLRVRMPAAPVVESWPYGSINDQDGRDHHTTVNGGHKHYMVRAVLRKMDNPKKDLPKLAAEAPEQLRQNIRRAVDKIYDEAHRQGYREEQVLLSMFDEQHDARTAEWLILAREVKKYRPQSIVISNPMAPDGERRATLAGTIELLQPYVDVWQPHLYMVNDQQVLTALKSAGKPVWFYKNVGLQLSRDERAASRFYRTAPWYSIKLNLKGIGFWSASRWVGDMWDDHDRDRLKDWSDAAVVFEDEARTAVTTRNWEAWREGIEDVAVACLLNLAADNALLPSRDRLEAQAWLAGAASAVIAGNGETEGRIVREKRAAALALIDRAWDEENPLDKLLNAATSE